VGEVAVEADRHAQAADHVEDREQRHVDPAEPPAPGERDSGGERQGREEHEHAHQEHAAGRALSVDDGGGSAAGGCGLERHASMRPAGAPHRQWRYPPYPDSGSAAAPT
jgi:hypothetical protein